VAKITVRRCLLVHRFGSKIEFETGIAAAQHAVDFISCTIPSTCRLQRLFSLIFVDEGAAGGKEVIEKSKAGIYCIYVFISFLVGERNRNEK
jgi:hypothetical protein